MEENEIDLIIAHNTSHPYNFITAVGLGIYFEELKANNYIWPKQLVWWHDSYMERELFKSAQAVIKYLGCRFGHLRGWNCMHDEDR
ncbi:MAG: hypothetical protein U5L09_02480 [Bacteroidales bacterium]|nr:hypothetical protein [Bacteroidales bacterium]